jgi:hypothetical protein
MAVEVDAGAYMNQPGEFSHNPLHDLESLWWVGVWFSLCHYQPGNLRNITVQKHIKVVKKYGETIFNCDNHVSRRRALIGPDILANIRPRSFVVAIQHLVVLLNSFRDQLFTNYTRYKPTPSQDRSFFNPDLHRKFANLVEEAFNELKNDKTVLWPMDHVEKRIVYYNAKK